MSDPSKHRLLRAVRLLPGAVRVGKGGMEEIDPEIENAQGFAEKSEPQSVDKSELLAAEAEIRKLKSELRNRESSLIEERSLTQDLQQQVTQMQGNMERERTELHEQSKREAAEAKVQASKEGHAEGHTKGYAEGVQKAEAEKRAEYEAKFADALKLLNQINESLDEAREKLALTHAPQLIRLWEVMLQRMLQAKVILDPSVVERLLESILKRVSDRERILVYLNSADIAMIESNKERLIDAIRGVKVFELLSDDYVDRGSCLIETNLGIYDARWKTQLEQVSAEVQALLMESMMTDEQTPGA